MKACFPTLLLFIIHSLSACGDQGSSEPAPELEQDAFDRVNDYRQGRGLVSLEWSELIAQVTRGHSQDMAAGLVDFGHDGADGRRDEISATLSFYSWGENVAWNQGYDDPAQRAVDGWIDSPSHHEIMIGDYQLSGMGVARADSGKIYFTQIFWRESPP
jgi:uncharacterized protein YkwD